MNSYEGAHTTLRTVDPQPRPRRRDIWFESHWDPRTVNISAAGVRYHQEVISE